MDEIETLLYHEFENGYQCIYTCRLREFYGDRIATVVDAVHLGRLIYWLTGYRIRHNENSGFLWIKSRSDDVNLEVKKALLDLLKKNSGMTKECICKELRFYPYHRINGILDKSEKVQKNKDSWEWNHMFLHNWLFYHVDNICFTNGELVTIKEIAKSMMKDKGLAEQASIILDVSKNLLENYGEKIDLIQKLIKIAEKLMPKEEVDIDALYFKLYNDDLAGIRSAVGDYGDVGVKKALGHILNQQDDVDLTDSIVEQEAEEVESV
jgi:hypothetical protein